MKISGLIGLSFFALSACASSPQTEVKDADERMVQQCQFLGHVSGGSMLGGAMQRRARERAQNEAIREAAKLGATHIVWRNVHSTSSQGATADGDAYRCPKSLR